MPNRIEYNFLCNNCTQISEKNDTFWVKCTLCGEYGIVRSLVPFQKDNFIKRKCSVMVRRYWEETGEKYVLDTGNYKSIAAKYDSFTLKEKISNFLIYLGEKTSPGKEISFAGYKLFVTPSIEESEFTFIWQYLKERGYVELGGGFSFMLTMEGWEEILEGEELINPKQCFIAMSLTNPEVKHDYENHIKPLLTKYEFIPVVMSEYEHNEDIVFEIYYHISRSRFIIVDVRDQKPNVYYEAGYAKGLGREVIWICPAVQVDKMQFDTRNLNHVIWKDKEELVEKLEKRIKGTILS